MEEQKREVDYQKWTWKVLEYTAKAVMGIIVIIALFVGIVNLLVDILYTVIDPRVKLGA